MPPAVKTYRPVFHRLPPNGGLLASGNYTMLTPAGAATGQATLVDQATGASGTIAFGGSGCSPAALTPVAVIWNCFGAAQDGTFVQSLAGQQVTALPAVGGVLAAAGTDWVQYDVLQSPTISHSATFREFVNIATHQVVVDSSEIGGRTYPDLDSAMLYKTACRPVTLGGSFDGSSRSDVPGSLAFFGPVAVGTDQDGSGVLRLQHCGSRHMLRIRAAAGAGSASNGRIIVWKHPVGKFESGIDGVLPQTERRFAIALPSAVTKGFLGGIALNARTLYVASGSGAAYRATLPKALQGTPRITMSRR